MWFVREYWLDRPPFILRKRLASFALLLTRTVLCACLLGLSACGTWRSGGAPTSGSSGSTSDWTPQKRHDVVVQAMAMLDRNYAYGGKKLHTGFDCSGLVSFVYKESAGVRLAGSAADMARQTRPIDAAQASPGDLVFFNTLGTSYSHVGIYIGDGKFIHAENEKTGVKTSNMNSAYWAKRFEGFRTL